MMRLLRSRLLPWIICLLCCNSAYAASLTLDDYLGMQGAVPDAQFRYGVSPMQYVAYFHPVGKGPFPLVILIHGGCWLNRYQGMPQLAPMAHLLAQQGIAVWSIEYRGLDTVGGGFPGTYTDIADALELIQRQSLSQNLNMSRVLLIGHSAGAQLAQWAAARDRIPVSSPLYRVKPLAIATVIGLGSLPDLRDERRIRNACGLDPALLTGYATDRREDVFADTSPAAMLPSRADIVLINGAGDTVSPPEVASRFAALARRAGNHVETIVIPHASHYDEVSVGSSVWPVIEKIVEARLISK